MTTFTNRQSADRTTDLLRRLAIGAVTATALLSGAAYAATPSSAAESRGYQRCVEAVDREVRVVKMDASYFIYEHDDSRRYYLNGYAFRNGESEPVKVACSTTPSGTRVLDVSVDQGRYAGRLVEPVNVARN